MHSRHRQSAFPSPFELKEIDPEFDIDRALWVPGRKKILIPSAPKPAFDWGIDWAKLDTKSLLFEQATCFRNLFLGGFDTRYCDCIPAREVAVIPAQDRQRYVAGTWADIRRSEVPMFRGGRRFRIQD